MSLENFDFTQFISFNIVKDLVFIICSFTDQRVDTTNVVLYIKKEDLWKSLFKMSMYYEGSQPYPYNLIINIID